MEPHGNMFEVAVAGSKWLCRTCGNSGQDSGVVVRIRETMFANVEAFDYMLCSDCGCLGLISLPDDMGRYYPEHYYSFAQPEHLISKLKLAAHALLAVNGPAVLFGGREWYELGRLKALRDARVTRSMRILDLGCGNGNLVASLRDIGFRHVSGADPFIDADICHPNGTRIQKCEASDLVGSYDIVMMHHSLEHVWDQNGVIREIYRLVAPGGRCIIRIPTIDCYAWEEYGTDWFQLDAPRHVTLHSRKSIRRLLESAGFEVEAIIDDSAPFHLLASEKIRLGHTAIDPETHTLNFEKTLPAEFIAAASKRVEALNKRGLGDQIAVHARKR